MDVAHTPDPVDVDDERTIDDDELAADLPDRLDVPFEEPLADVIEQRRIVVLDTDDYDA